MSDHRWMIEETLLRVSRIEEKLDAYVAGYVTEQTVTRERVASLEARQKVIIGALLLVVTPTIGLLVAQAITRF